MGIVLGVEAGVAAVEAIDAVAAGTEAGEAIESGAAAGAEAGTQAGAEGGALASTELLVSTIIKLGKMLEEFFVIDAVFKTAEMILRAATSDPALANRLGKLLDVFKASTAILKSIIAWLKANQDKHVCVNDYIISLNGILANIIAKLGAAVGVLQKLSKKIDEKNRKKQPITVGEVDALEKGLQTEVAAFISLADFKSKHVGKIPELYGLPIDEGVVINLQKQLP